MTNVMIADCGHPECVSLDEITECLRTSPGYFAIDAAGRTWAWEFDLKKWRNDELGEVLNTVQLQHAHGPITQTVDTVPLALTAFVAGKPAPQGSKRGIATRHGKVAMIESSKNVKPWRESIRHALLDDHGRARATYPDGPIHVRIEFVMPRPASTPKRRTPPAVKRPDIDKLARAVLDAISSAGVWTDDSQVTHLDATKRIAELDEQPGCHIAISEAR